MNSETQKSPVLVAALWMLGMVFSLSTIAISARELSAQMGPFQMIFFRCIFGLLALTPIVLYQYGQIPLSKKFGNHIARNMSHYGGQVFWFFGISYLSLAEVFAIEFTTPMWTLLLAYFILGEKITRWRAVSLVFGLIGMMLILRPGLENIHFASFLVIVSAFCFALSHIFTRKLAQIESPTMILFYMGLVQAPIAIIPALFNWVTPEGLAWMWLLFMGIASITAHYCLSRALALADASIMIPIDFLRLPMIMLVGYVFYGEDIDVFIVLGASIMFAGNFLNVRNEHKHQQNDVGH
ncbi:MAG: EamA family transporter [Gammaproteobacteria bacterium]|nr:EamA family transporter [Gammaproteobacteria bacterium]